MTTLLATRPRPAPCAADVSLRDGTSSAGFPARRGTTAAGTSSGKAYLAVIVPAAEAKDAVVAQWRAELQLAECSRRLPLDWPLPEWLDDYRDLLVIALADPRNEAKKVSPEGEIGEFLRLVLAGHDKSAGELVRTLSWLFPFSAVLRRLRRVQALFASIRPARSLAEMLDFRILDLPVTPQPDLP